MKYLISGSGGPGFASPDEALRILENIVLPGFDALIDLQKKGKILAGGLPVGDRAFTFIMEADSNNEVDRVLRKIPLWGLLDWEVVALQTVEERAALEREIVKQLKGA
ncbi:MAG: hypothetical protein C4560_13925 [Nitrospiraceae bacterium]|nr:MAG: hypothetical protein C4560_13925 [Nitrospiraceae bacterium]